MIRGGDSAFLSVWDNGIIKVANAEVYNHAVE